MADEPSGTTVEEPQQPEVVVVEAPPATPAAPAAETPPAVGDAAAELERTRVALKAANKESAERRKRLEKFEAEEEARKEAAMSDLDKEKKRADAAEARAEAAERAAKDTLIRAAFVSEAAKAGAAHPEDVYLLADWSAVGIDESGTVEGVAEVVKSLVDAGRVPLAGRPQAPRLDGGAGNAERPRTQVTLTAAEIETARRMGITPEKYAAQKQAISQEAIA